MKFYTFGEVEHPVILLLPGTCCHWRLNFGEVVPPRVSYVCDTQTKKR